MARRGWKSHSDPDYPFAYVGGNPVNYVDLRGLDKPGCDVPFGGSISNACVLEACARHDAYYDGNCNAWSWLNPFASAGCHSANSSVFFDILGCIGNHQDDPNQPNYYCGNGKWRDSLADCNPPPSTPPGGTVPPSGGNGTGGNGFLMCPIEDEPLPQEPECWSGHSGNTAWGGCMHTSSS